MTDKPQTTLTPEESEFLRRLFGHIDHSPNAAVKLYDYSTIIGPAMLFRADDIIQWASGQNAPTPEQCPTLRQYFLVEQHKADSKAPELTKEAYAILLGLAHKMHPEQTHTKPRNLAPQKESESDAPRAAPTPQVEHVRRAAKPLKPALLDFESMTRDSHNNPQTAKSLCQRVMQQKGIITQSTMQDYLDGKKPPTREHIGFMEEAGILSSADSDTLREQYRSTIHLQW